jgi:hypothetical protein
VDQHVQMYEAEQEEAVAGNGQAQPSATQTLASESTAGQQED